MGGLLGKAFEAIFGRFEEPLPRVMSREERLYEQYLHGGNTSIM